MVEKEDRNFFRDVFLKEDDQTETSDDFECKKYRRFLLHVHLVKHGDPADSTVEIKVQFYHKAEGLWSDYQNGPFGFMLWEEDAIPSGDAGLNVATSGLCIGSQIRIQLVADKPAGATLDATNYFTATVSAEFMD